MNFNILIVDDEPGARQFVRNILASECPDVGIAGEAGSVAEALDLLLKTTPDLILLDVEMGDGTGFDLLDRAPALPFNVVFTTAHDDFAVRAFRYNAVDFLLKPLDAADLVTAVRKAQQNRHKEQLQQQLTELLRANESKNLNRITLRTGKGLVFAPVLDILHIESCGNYSFVYLASGERHLDARNLKEYEDMLPQPGFLRVHQSHMVNMVHIQKLEKGSDGLVVVLHGGHIVPVSRRRREALEGF
ncbi:MAG: LytTR family DNA-binding domain-containing protein [Saprospiraceae bacterium]